MKAATDPAWAGVGRLLIPGFEWHPHRGIESITTVVNGVLEYSATAWALGAHGRSPGCQEGVGSSVPATTRTGCRMAGSANSSHTEPASGWCR